MIFVATEFSSGAHFPYNMIFKNFDFKEGRKKRERTLRDMVECS